MARKVFFSWQSDTPSSIGKNFLEGILAEVCKKISQDTAFEASPRDSVVIDSDTKNVPGQPPIFETILKKIDAADVFIADLTPVARRKDESSLISNPNVLIEYGYAIKSLNYERVIYVMNLAYGSPGKHGENLPFDLRHARHPICYNLLKSSTADEVTKERDKLVKVLEDAIRLSLGVRPPAPPAAIYVEKPALDGPARFRSTGIEIGLKDVWFGEDTKKVILPPGAAMWLRIMPVTPLEKRLRLPEVKKIVQGNSAPFGTLISRGGGYDYVRAADGIGLYYSPSREYESAEYVTTPAVAFIFTTGEIWTIDTAFLQFSKNEIPYCEPYFIEALSSYRNLLGAVGIAGPYKWIAGMTGLKDRRIEMPPPPPGRAYIERHGPTCVEDTITAEGLLQNDDDVREQLTPFFEEIFEKCGMERPAHLND